MYDAEVSVSLPQGAHSIVGKIGIMITQVEVWTRADKVGERERHSTGARFLREEWAFELGSDR